MHAQDAAFEMADIPLRRRHVQENWGNDTRAYCDGTAPLVLQGAAMLWTHWDYNYGHMLKDTVVSWCSLLAHSGSLTRGSPPFHTLLIGSERRAISDEARFFYSLFARRLIVVRANMLQRENNTAFSHYKCSWETRADRS